MRSLSRRTQPISTPYLDYATDDALHKQTILMEDSMNKEQVDGKIEQLQGLMKQTWGKLTDNDLMLYNGKREQFLGKLKDHYGLAKEDAEKKIQALQDSVAAASKSTAKVA
jgi:uncharacterized protein YjbJ (UPF0337 family)